MARTRGSAKHQPIQGTVPGESQQAGSKYLIPLIKQHHTLETKHLMAFQDGEFAGFPLDETKIQGLDLEPRPPRTENQHDYCSDKASGM